MCGSSLLSTKGTFLPIITTFIIIVISLWYQKSLHTLAGFISARVTVSVLFHLIATIIAGEKCIVPNAKIAFKQGLQMNTNIMCCVEREAAQSELKEVLKPQFHSGGYFIYEGRHGCGKTTIVKQAISQIGSGVLYVRVGYDGDVGASLLSALKIDTHCQSLWVNLLSYLKVPVRKACQNLLSTHWKS